MLVPQDTITDRQMQRTGGKMNPEIVILDEKEVHLMGTYVGVIWNVEKKQKTIKGEDGVTYRGEIAVRTGGPYIDFITIREDGEGEPFEDEDSPVAGGLNTKAAAQIITELYDAISYIDGKVYEKG